MGRKGYGSERFTKVFVLRVLVLFSAACPVRGAVEPSDYELRVVPASTSVDPNRLGKRDFSVRLLSKVEGAQGWSFGVILEATGGATGAITRVKIADDTLTVNNGAPPDFCSTGYYVAGNLLQKESDCDPECADIEAAAVTQGVVISFRSAVTLPATDSFGLVDITVSGTGPQDSKLRLNFTDDVGTPPVQTVVVHGEEAIRPAVQEGGVLEFVPHGEPVPPKFTIDIADAEGSCGGETESLVTLNFNPDGSMEGSKIMGWSYGLCVEHPERARPVRATTDETDTATVKNGSPPDYDVVELYHQGLTHAVVIDFEAEAIPVARNDWADLRVTYQLTMSDSEQSTYITPCDKTLGSPPMANVVVVGGASIPFSHFAGKDPNDPEACPYGPELCNKPGKLSGAVVPYFRPGDANGDRRLDIADGIFILNYMFRYGPAPGCLATCDFNHDSVVDASDAVAVIFWRLQPPLPDRPPEGWPGPALGLGCAPHETILPCDVPCEP